MHTSPVHHRRQTEKSATDTLGLQREEIHVEKLKRTDARESGRRTSGTGGENHGSTDERIDAHESGRTSGTGGKNHGCTDVIERPDQPSDAYESARSLPARIGLRRAS